jgi:hypothetical protein
MGFCTDTTVLTKMQFKKLDLKNENVKDEEDNLTND